MNYDSTWPQTEIKKRNHERDKLPLNQTASLFKTRATRGPTGLPLKAVSSPWLKASKQKPLGKHAAHKPLAALSVSEFMSRFIHSYRLLCRPLLVPWLSLFFGLLQVYGTIFHTNQRNPFELQVPVDRWHNLNTGLIWPQEQVGMAVLLLDPGLIPLRYLCQSRDEHNFYP